MELEFVVSRKLNKKYILAFVENKTIDKCWISCLLLIWLYKNNNVLFLFILGLNINVSSIKKLILNQLFCIKLVLFYL